MATTSTTVTVGSIIRATRPNLHAKFSSKAIIATLNCDDIPENNATSQTSVCLIWEPIDPKPIQSSKIEQRFLVCPMPGKTINEITLQENANDDDEEEEINVGIDQIQELFPFELEDQQQQPNYFSTLSVSSLKDHGDTLFKCGDPSAAVPLYELALRKISTNVSIGGSIVVAVKGYPKIAEVDCIDDDDRSVDVTIIGDDSGDSSSLEEIELTVKKSKILLVCSHKDFDDRMQERILLNLARCMLHLADLSSIKFRPKYLKSAVLACSLAIAVSDFHNDRPSTKDNDNNINNNQNNNIRHPLATTQTALLLRAKAQGLLSNFSKAFLDARRLISSGKTDEGSKLLENLQRRKRQTAKNDKKLAKAVCELVQNATTASENLLVSDNDSNDEIENEHSIALEKSSSNNATDDTQRPFSTVLAILSVLLAVVLIQFHG